MHHITFDAMRNGALQNVVFPCSVLNFNTSYESVVLLAPTVGLKNTTIADIMINNFMYCMNLFSKNFDGTSFLTLKQIGYAFISPRKQ